jgi:DNA-binding transcriptional LysR family regulator
MHDLDENLSNIKTGLAGKIRIGSVTGPAVKYIVPSVQALKDTSPEIDVTVEVAPSRQLLRQLLSGQLDLVLARILPEFSEAELSITPIGDEQVAMLVRQDHPLSNRKNLSLAEIVDHEWILQEMDSPIREAVIAALHMEKLSSPSNVLSSSSLLFALGYLSRSDAIAAVSSEVAQLLVESPVAASFVTLDIRKRFDIKPYFLIKLEAHVESPVERKLVEFIHATVAGDHLL